MRTYKLLLSYDGSKFVGWQVQPNQYTIQGSLQKALQTLLKKSITVIGAGRTDAGVHALEQCAHFRYDEPFDVKELHHRLNAILPRSIRVQELYETHPSFHALFSALSKEYQYHIWQEATSSPFLYPYRYHLPYPLDIEEMKKCASLFIGTHDFSSFCNINCEVKDKVRTLLRIDILPQEGGIRLEFEGKGFLYKMVRNLTTPILLVGSHKISISKVQEVLDAKKRTEAFAPAPAQGLFLAKIVYPEIFSKKQSNEGICMEGFLS